MSGTRKVACRRSASMGGWLKACQAGGVPAGCGKLDPPLMRLLIIDDDTELCQLVADYLKPMGFEVEMEHDGERGADRATSEAWAAVLLDVMMPGCDGFEVLRRIRAKSRVPVMMLTGRGEEVDRIVGLELGADDYLPKTFSSRELLARLRAVLRRSGWLAESAPQVPVNSHSARVQATDATAAEPSSVTEPP